jgi:tRNA modification GTPase
MPHDLDDTIVAIASAPGGAIRGIVRASGPDVLTCIRHYFSPPCLDALRQPTATAGHLQLPGLHAPLPATVYYWPGRRSYTRQPVVEIHTLGSPPLLQLVVRALCESGARPAEPGEFTLRAFLAGRLDLTQAEAVLGLIDAAGRRDFELALAQLAGGLAGPLGSLRDSLLDLLAQLEAGLDFVEEDIEFIRGDEIQRQLASAIGQIDALLGRMHQRLDSSEQVRVVLSGWPNVGKSSLFNALAGEARAMVSPTAGTTRDYLTAELELEGIACLLVDTAGREPEQASGIAASAQRLRGGQQAAAHLELLCLDSTRPLNAWEQAALAGDASAKRLVVWTKSDGRRAADIPANALVTSSATGAGIEELKLQIAAALQAMSSEGPVVASTAARCQASLQSALESLRRAHEIATPHGEGSYDGQELVAAEIRVVLSELGKVVGAVYTDDILDRIFSRFCIGK